MKVPLIVSIKRIKKYGVFILSKNQILFISSSKKQRRQISTSNIYIID